MTTPIKIQSTEDGCSIPVCSKPRYSKGYCKAHYHRLWRYGDPLAGNTLEGAPMQFIHEVVVLHTGECCLTWPFGKNEKGYGNVWANGTTVRAHRYVCELVHGAPPTPEHEAAHSCGKGHEACIAPGHLGWKTHKENMADKLIHGTHQCGERIGTAKLTEAIVREIISLRGTESQSKLGERFGVAQPTIAHIYAGRSWGWLSNTSEGRSHD